MKTAKAICLILAVILLVSGCSIIKENNDITDLELPSPLHVDAAGTERTITPSLYFFDSSYTKLSVETREITVYEGQQEAEVITEALLSGPEDSSYRTLGSGLSLDYIEMSRDIANVYILSDRTYDEQRRFMISVAITNTISDYFGVTYVTVFINGSALKISGYPCTLLKKSTTLGAADLYNEYVARYSSQYYIDNEEHDITVILYFPDKTGTYILPEARTIPMVFTEDTEVFRTTFAKKLIEELAKGPKTNDDLTVCLNSQSAQSDFFSVSFDDEYKKIDLDFLRTPFVHSDNSTLNNYDPVMAASVYYTLVGAIGDIARVEISHLKKTQRLSRALSKIYMGSLITLYFPKTSENSLSAVTRTVYCDNAHMPKTYITELMRGPLETDADSIKNAFSDKMNSSMFISANVKNGTVYIDMTEEFADAAAKMSDDDERMMFYSMINTLCSISRIKDVQFLINGEYRGDIGGVMHIEYPLLPNQGLLG